MAFGVEHYDGGSVDGERTKTSWCLEDREGVRESETQSGHPRFRD